MNRLNRAINTIRYILISLLLMMLHMTISFASIDPELEAILSPDEREWLFESKDELFFIGLDPLAGMEYFISDQTEQGYLKSITDFLSRKTTLNLVIKPDLSWNEAVDDLESGAIQILFGANPTPERLKTMDFTDPIYSVPYTVLSQVNGDVQNIGDLNGKRVGFLEGDIVISILEDAYTNLHYDVISFDDQLEGLSALHTFEIDAFITSGGDVVYDYLFRYPDLKVVVNFEEIRSLMTFSALKSNATLISILSKSLSLYEGVHKSMIDEARHQYIRKILDLTPLEKAWLKKNPSIRVGVPNDYLPVDHYENGQYKGIAGHYMTAFAELIGLEIVPVTGSFDEVYEKINLGEIDVLNMAITSERLDKFIFTDAFSNERDQIYGHRDSKYVHDIYGLEGKRVAVIKGFWHIDHLNLNLQNPELILVSDIKEAIEAVVRGKADYFIETPAVAEFYISGLGYTNIIKKGETSSDSFLYFGLLKQHKPLVSI
ncbi:MAG TPA: hypothetical protein DCS67_08565, partial [Clostridiales bacterium UBA8960]|nr:hypothetical protein [Clostridiales bacterium UBA8960]